MDFRKLIKVLADTFHVRIEMKQIGARQEAGRIGGIGPCGRELCCATWMKNFVSVSTAAARLQDISLNPQKLAGQCAKLKCCLNYEYATYAEASRKLPSREVPLETQDGTYYYFKADILAGLVSYSTDKRLAANVKTITAQRAMEIIQMNHRGEKPVSLEEEAESAMPQQPVDLVEQNSLTRFDRSKRRKKNNKHNGRKNGEAKAQPAETGSNATAETSDRTPRNEAKPQPTEAGGNGERPERNNRRNGNRQNNRPRRERKPDEGRKDNAPRKSNGEPPKSSEAAAK